MKLINVVTPCTRLKNLPHLYNSILPFKDKVVWWIIYDAPFYLNMNNFNEDWIREFSYHDDNSVTGNAQRNFALDQINEGWYYPLDDDNLLHPNLIPKIEEFSNLFPFIEGFTFSQQLNTFVRPGNRVEECQIDQAQFILTKKLIGDSRYPIEYYTGDGKFIEKLHKENRDKFHCIDEVLCYYNLLRKE